MTPRTAGDMSETLTILRDRAARGSRAPHGDGYRVALAIEGGSMRGVVSAGMVTALEELGLTHAFDAVYGSSAGSLNAAYFLAGQAALGTSIYSENINCARFTNLWRAIGPNPIVNITFLLDEVMTRIKPLAVSRVLASPAPLAVLATDVATATRVILREFVDRDDLFGALRAGATMPIIAGMPHTYRGRDCFDASLTEPIPVPAAEADGHTHIVALLTRPAGHKRAMSSLVERVFVGRSLAKISPELADRFAHRGRPYAALLHTLDAGTGPGGTAKVVAVRPTGDVVSKFEHRRDRLLAAADDARRAVMAVFHVH